MSVKEAKNGSAGRMQTTTSGGPFCQPVLSLFFDLFVLAIGQSSRKRQDIKRSLLQASAHFVKYRDSRFKQRTTVVCRLHP
jgi:hypothetical protein